MSTDGAIVIASIREGEEGDRRINFADRLLSFSFEDHARKADKAVFRLDNWDLQYLDDETWQRGQKIEVAWGYPGQLHTPQEVILKKVSGGAVLQIEGHAKSTLLHDEQKTRTFNSMLRSDVAKQIAQERGFSGDQLHIQNTDQVFDTINQASETDAQFMKRLANREGFDFWVDATGFHWEDRADDGKPTHVLIYYTDPGRGEILDFNLESDLFLQPGRIDVRARDPRTKKPINATGSDKQTNRTELAEEIEVVDPVTGETTIRKRMAHKAVRHTSAKTEAEAKREADARFKKAARNRIKLKLDLVGDPTMTAKRVIEVRGLGQYLSGKYYVLKALHKIDGNGYVTTIHLRRGTAGKVAGGKGKQTEAKRNRNQPGRGDELYEKVDEQTGETTYHRRERRN